MKRLSILVLMVLVSCGLFAQARPSFDQIASGTGKFSDGASSTPSITFGSDPDTGLYRYGANQIGVSQPLIFPATQYLGWGGSNNYIQFDASGNMLLGTSGSVRATIKAGGNMIVGGTTDDGVNKLQVNGGLAIAGTVPASTGATGVAGSVRYDSDYIYICVAANTWKRVAIATW